MLFVTDLERAERFYTGVLGMVVAVREPRPNAAFLRLPRSGNHHDLGLFGVAGAPPKRRGGVELYHLAWQLDTGSKRQGRRCSMRGRTPVTVERVLVATLEDAERWGFLGSPTVLVDGRDPSPSPGQRWGYPAGCIRPPTASQPAHPRSSS